MTNKTHTLKELQALRAGWNELAIEREIPERIRGIASLLGKSHKWAYTSQTTVQVIHLAGELLYTFDLLHEPYSWTVFVRRFEHRGGLVIFEDKYDELINWTDIYYKKADAADFEVVRAMSGIANRFVIPGDWWEIVDTLYKKANEIEKQGNAENNKIEIDELAETLMIETVDNKYLNMEKMK